MSSTSQGEVCCLFAIVQDGKTTDFIPRHKESEPEESQNLYFWDRLSRRNRCSPLDPAFIDIEEDLDDETKLSFTKDNTNTGVTASNTEDDSDVDTTSDSGDESENDLNPQFTFREVIVEYESMSDGCEDEEDIDINRESFYNEFSLSYT